MTDNVKVISRPKVRFRQISDDVQNKEKPAGPRIKEIISLKRPIRIVEPTKQSVSVEDCNIDGTTSNNTSNTSDGIRNMSLSENRSPKVEGTKILRDANAIQNTKKNCKISQLEKSSQDDVLKDCTKDLRQKEKENQGIRFKLKRATCSKSISEPITEKRNNSQLHMQSLTREKFKLSTDTKSNCMHKINVGDFKRRKMTKSQSAPSIMKKTRDSLIDGRSFNAKPSTSCLTSRYKTVAKNKISPVKKIVLRNVRGPKIKTSVEPGVFRKEQDTAMTSDANERRAVRSNVTVQDLAQPEYNSIMCTINKLKELEQQRIVTDISHLPSALKTFLNGKISAALDFPLDETIYKNLVDLSIDEKQLPSIIMRSKDPEPREKDLVPKLDDFFMPEDAKEVCEAVHVKSQASKINDNWNAFKISDKILEWKYSIDDID